MTTKQVKRQIENLTLWMMTIIVVSFLFAVMIFTTEARSQTIPFTPFDRFDFRLDPPEHDPHDPDHWFEFDCCHSRDCKVIPFTDIKITPQGYWIKDHPWIIPHESRRIRTTLPGGKFNFAICTEEGKIENPLICFYVPPSGT